MNCAVVNYKYTMWSKKVAKIKMKIPEPLQMSNISVKYYAYFSPLPILVAELKAADTHQKSTAKMYIQGFSAACLRVVAGA